MSKIKTLETLLVNSAEALTKVLRQVRSSQTPKQTLTNIEEILSHDDVGEVIAWNRARKRQLKQEGTKTVEAKMVTSKVAKERHTKEVDELEPTKRTLSKRYLMGKSVFFTKRKQSPVTRVFSRAGERWVELEDGQEFAVSSLVDQRDGVLHLSKATNAVKKESKKARQDREEEVHAIITKVAGNGAYVEANNLSAFCNKVIAGLEAQYAAGEISRVLLRQTKAYVVDHHLKVDNMKELKVKGAVAKVTRLTVKANKKASDKGIMSV